MRRRSSSKETGTEELHINLTPLIDVVFVILIMFIVIAPMLELDRVELAGAAQKEGREVNVVKEVSAIAIYVHEDNTIWVNQQRVVQKQLLSLLKNAHLKNPSAIPQVFHDKKAHFGTYQMVKNTVEEAGFERMDVILQP